MRRKLVILAGSMVFLAAAVLLLVLYINRTGRKASEGVDSSIHVVTSFYPVYVLTINMTDGISDIKVDSLTDFSRGCLHDYRLTTNDMRLLSDADVFVINGGGMEEYLQDVMDGYPNLKIINLGEGIDMLESKLHEGEKNPHVWLDPQLYMVQIENARKGLTDFIGNFKGKRGDGRNIDEEDKDRIIDKINSNAEAYTARVRELSDEMDNLLDTVKGKAESNKISAKVVVFHDSFAYLAGKAGLETAYAVEIDEDTPLSAGEVAEIINAVRQDNIRFLFTEEQYDDNIANRISEETGAQIYIIDSAVTGDAEKDSYLKAMRKNIDTLKGAFEEP